MTVTPPNAASRPSPAKTLTGATLAGSATADDGDTKTYTASKSGTATDVVFALTSNESGDVVNGLNITFAGAGARVLTLTATSADLGISRTDTLSVTIS